MTETTEPLRWTIGDVRVTRIHEGAFDLPCDVLFPGSDPADLQAMDWLKPYFVNADGTVSLSIHTLLVETPSLRIVVDTCMGNDKDREMVGNRLDTDYLDRFEAQGVARDRVDMVLCTHLHNDHVGWNTMLRDGEWVPTFPNARYLFGRTEYEFWKENPQTGDDRALFVDSVQPVIAAGLADFVDTDHRICDEVQLRPTPGHTPGHVSVMIESQGERAMITGDATHHPSQWTRPEWAAMVDTDPEGSVRTRRALAEEFSDYPILVIGTHYMAPCAGHLVSSDGTSRFVTD